MNISARNSARPRIISSSISIDGANSIARKNDGNTVTCVRKSVHREHQSGCDAAPFVYFTYCPRLWYNADGI